MTSQEIRKQFLKFFQDRSHTIVSSAPVIPYDDPTLLFTNAGMNQFKDVFLGTGKRPYVRAADTQKCIRVSGKHNDLEEVGRDTYHHTFFEMLGNWSFGDYYKKEAIEWAWELLTKEWKLDKKRLYATIYETDDEAGELWKKVTDIDPSHIVKFGKKDNFWEMGETGPCGPCSEIHIDLSEKGDCGHLVNAGDPRVMEIWNLVFIQYNSSYDKEGEDALKLWDNTSQNDRQSLPYQSRNEIVAKYRRLDPLPAKHVDTGMGFERICAVLQGKKSNYDTDVFTPIIQHIASLVGKQYTGLLDGQTDIAMRVIADHVRMLSFSIADGGIPSNEGRGYVMRRLLRRAARFGRNLGMHEPFIYKVVEAVVKSMGDQFPEIKEKQSHIERVIKGEEESFNATLDRGIEMHQAEVQRSKNAGEKIFSGEVAFKLHDTYGFPIDMTEMMAREEGLSVNESRFTELMEIQKNRSRSDAKVTMKSILRGGANTSVEDKETARNYNADKFRDRFRFEGYEKYESRGTVLEATEKLVILDRTTFYGESGGQVGDKGELYAGSRIIKVADTQKSGDVNVHILDTEYMDFVGASNYKLNPGEEVITSVDRSNRLPIEFNHTATHLMHEGLRRVIGTHSHQQGSLVHPDYLRFDFNHFEKVTPDQLRAIEDIVNEKIAESITVNALNDPNEWLTIEEAKKRYPNIKMFFGDKYGDRVRVVEIDPKFSVELCGGTHVKNTKDLGLFKIVSESSIASGVRRIEAVTGEGLQQYIQKRLNEVGELDERLAKLIEEKEDLEKQLGQYKKVEVSSRPSLGRVSLSSETPTRQTIDAVEQAHRLSEETIESVTKSTHDLKKELSRYRVKEASSGIEDLTKSGVAINGFKVVSAKVEAGSMDELKSLGDALRSKLQSGVGVLGAVVEDKVALVCVVTDDLVKDKKLQAGKIVGELAKRVGGGGGGRPHLATAGGKDIAKLDETLNEAASIVKAMVGK